jgi:Fic family protein
VQEHARVHELEVELEQATLAVEEAGRTITDGYAAEDEQAVREARKRERAAVEKLEDLEHRLAGAAIRAERAGERVDVFQTERAGDLLSEAEDAARDTTADLRRAVQETVRIRRQYKQDRTAIQQLVNRIEPGAGQVNGPPSSCAWERELADLERGLKRGDDLEPPLPRWHGKVWRRQEDEAARRLRSERREGATA